TTTCEDLRKTARQHTLSFISKTARWDDPQTDSKNIKTGLLVALKRLNNSPNINDKILNELKYHLNASKMTEFLFPLLGITRDPETSEYMI
ncbi:464_t:CDS:2, partial [Cetraspora pellucida]